MNKFNVSHIKLCTELEGPFKRCCIWFQGCDILCKGCCNKDLQELKPKNIVSEEEILKAIIFAKDKYEIEGITLSGGEPTIQKNLTHLNNEIHKLGLGIIMFSGHNLKDINEELVKSVDLLIAGPFIENKLDTNRLLIGSRNKELVFITDRYKNYENYFFTSTSKEEVCIDDYIFINGD